MKQVEKATGKTPKALIPPNFPDEIAYLWEDFLQLSTHRSSTFGGAPPLLFSEIESWSKVTGKTLSPFELDVILALDNLWKEIASEEE